MPTPLDAPTQLPQTPKLQRSALQKQFIKHRLQLLHSRHDLGGDPVLSFWLTIQEDMLALNAASHLENPTDRMLELRSIRQAKLLGKKSIREYLGDTADQIGNRATLIEPINNGDVLEQLVRKTAAIPGMFWIRGTFVEPENIQLKRLSKEATPEEVEKLEAAFKQQHASDDLDSERHILYILGQDHVYLVKGPIYKRIKLDETFDIDYPGDDSYIKSGLLQILGYNRAADVAVNSETRIPKQFLVTQSKRAIISAAAPVADTWTTGLPTERLTAGGEQLCAPLYPDGVPIAHILRNPGDFSATQVAIANYVATTDQLPPSNWPKPPAIADLTLLARNRLALAAMGPAQQAYSYAKFVLQNSVIDPPKDAEQRAEAEAYQALYAGFNAYEAYAIDDAIADLEKAFGFFDQRAGYEHERNTIELALYKIGARKLEQLHVSSYDQSEQQRLAFMDLDQRIRLGYIPDQPPAMPQGDDIGSLMVALQMSLSIGLNILIIEHDKTKAAAYIKQAADYAERLEKIMPPKLFVTLEPTLLRLYFARSSVAFAANEEVEGQKYEVLMEAIFKKHGEHVDVLVDILRATAPPAYRYDPTWLIPTGHTWKKEKEKEKKSDTIIKKVLTIIPMGSAEIQALCDAAVAYGSFRFCGMRHMDIPLFKIKAIGHRFDPRPSDPTKTQMYELYRVASRAQLDQAHPGEDVYYIDIARKTLFYRHEGVVQLFNLDDETPIPQKNKDIYDYYYAEYRDYTTLTHRDRFIHRNAQGKEALTDPHNYWHMKALKAMARAKALGKIEGSIGSSFTPAQLQNIKSLNLHKATFDGPDQANRFAALAGPLARSACPFETIEIIACEIDPSTPHGLRDHQAVVDLYTKKKPFLQRVADDYYHYGADKRFIDEREAVLASAPHLREHETSLWKNGEAYAHFLLLQMKDKYTRKQPVNHKTYQGSLSLAAAVCEIGNKMLQMTDPLGIHGEELVVFKPIFIMEQSEFEKLQQAGKHTELMSHVRVLSKDDIQNPSAEVRAHPQIFFIGKDKLDIPAWAKTHTVTQLSPYHWDPQKADELNPLFLKQLKFVAAFKKAFKPAEVREQVRAERLLASSVFTVAGIGATAWAVHNQSHATQSTPAAQPNNATTSTNSQPPSRWSVVPPRFGMKINPSQSDLRPAQPVSSTWGKRSFTSQPLSQPTPTSRVATHSVRFFAPPKPIAAVGNTVLRGLKMMR